MQNEVLPEQNLRSSVSRRVSAYFDALGEKRVEDLYEQVLSEVEPPMLEVIMKAVRYNQSHAARLMGISRGNLRTKLKKYFGLKYIGTRDALK